MWGGFHLLSLPPPFSPSRRTPIRSTLLEYYNIGRTPGLAFWKHLSHVPRIPQREVRENSKSAISPPPPPPLPFLLFEMYPKKSSSSGCRPHCRQGWAGRAQPKNARRERREGVEISLALFDRILLSLSSAALSPAALPPLHQLWNGAMDGSSLAAKMHPSPGGWTGKGEQFVQHRSHCSCCCCMQPLLVLSARGRNLQGRESSIKNECCLIQLSSMHITTEAHSAI